MLIYSRVSICHVIQPCAVSTDIYIDSMGTGFAAVQSTYASTRVLDLVDCCGFCIRQVVGEKKLYCCSWLCYRQGI